ncbi:MAG: 3-phosphoshikimate 1-carboxyvinyltransferase, partial [Acidimicrobiales bacterium]
MEATVEPVDRIEGQLVVPGDKSISHRGLILAAMASGTSTIRGCPPGRDVASTASSLRRLGVEVDSAGPGGVGERAGPGGVRELAVRGTGWEVVPEATLDAGNSATTMRLLAGALAGRPGSFRFVGDESLSKRPMDRIADPLRRMGALVELSQGRYPPIRVTGASLTGISYRLPVASAQVKGAILLAGLQAQGATCVLEEPASRDHTERMLAWLGAPVEVTPGRVMLEGHGLLPLPAFELDVPGDFSSAAFWIVAASLVSGSDLHLVGVGLNPTRTGLLEILASMGAAIELEKAAGGP